jgi:hypothetical protein
MATVFFSYSHKDEPLRDELEKHLAMLKREGAITAWHDRGIKAGEHIDAAIDKHLEQADVILLLVSSDFLASEYCYSIEMNRAMKRHEAGQAKVIPIILRSCDWHPAPFGKLLAAPTDGKPVTSWRDQDEAFLDITKAIRKALEDESSTSAAAPRASPSSPASRAGGQGPRSSNLRMRKEFSERERDAFLDEAFDYMAAFFENSLAELEHRNSGIEGSFKRIDTATFLATVYRAGKAIARCTIKNAGQSRSAWNGITIANGPHQTGNSINESLTVDAGDHDLYLKSLGLAIGRNRGEGRMNKEAAAEYYWSVFVGPLQE